jgi:hypothetical protein
MVRDPFYRQVDQALDGPPNGEVFQQCMVDLLRRDYPWIVAMSSGADSGMDGAIADREGEPLPLVCTVEEDVIGNLTYSLDSYLKGGGPRRKVVLATSRRLTNRRKQNLYKRAREKHFKLLQIFDREPLVERLMVSPRWCKELLGLTWKASLLSVVPTTRRPLIEIEPVGRDKDLYWIGTTQGDRVLSGEPGSGKTFLFHHLIRKRDWPGLFLVGRDLDGFRDAWIEQQPKIVVVDDAHDAPEVLVKLVRLRKEMEASFEIVATTWEAEREAVMDALGVPATRAHKLELLTRDEILEVIRRVGVEAPDEVLRDLVSQAANKPGLAVTIASLWLQGAYEDVLLGTALARTLTIFFRRYLGSESTVTLACLALGGDRGMELEVVGEFLKLDRARIWEIAKGLAAGGVLSEVERNVLSVWPRKLRYGLLSSTFFTEGPGPHDNYHALLGLAPSRERAIETLVGAKHHGAAIPTQEIRSLVAQSGSREAWRGLATLSKEDALWVLEHYPGDLVDIADATLARAGEASILRLLRRAETASDAPHSHSDHPLRILQAWVQDLGNPPDEMILRRKLLAKVSKEYLETGGQRPVGIQSIGLALSPSLESHSSDPGMGRTITIRSGLLPLEQLREVETIWADVLGQLNGIETEEWQYLSSVLWNWMYPSYASKGRPVSEEMERFMRSFAARVLKDVAPSAEERPGLATKVKEFAQKIGLDLNLEPDPVFVQLFPSTDHFFEDRESREAEWQAALGELAARWVSQNPAEIAELLVGYEREAQRIGRAWFPRRDLEVCRRIAVLTDAPEAWLDALLDRGSSGVLTGPFLERIVEVRRDGWEHQAERFLGLERQHAWSAVEAILRIPSPPAHLLEKALGRLGELPQLLESLCLSKQVHVETLRMLLHHPRWELALTAAVEEWNSDREGGVRAEVASDWRSAILRANTDSTADEELRDPSREHWLGVILAKDPGLAFDWLTIRLRDPEKPSFIAGDGPFGLALSVLTRDQRFRLVEELEKGGERAPWGFMGLLAGKDSEVFAKVLAVGSLRDCHLEPLEFLPDETWMELARLAMQAGHDLDKVVQASLWPKGQIRIMSRTGLENWQEHERAFARFETDPRDRVREIARRGRQLAAEQCREAEERERQFAIHGRYV